MAYLHLNPWLLVGSLTIVAGCDFGKSPDTGDEDSGTSTGDTECPAVAMVCPDGSMVGPRGPNCEYTPCPGEDTGEGCPLDAKICPDGSAVGREGPDCTFAPCPDETPCTADAKICADGSTVGRQGPDCEFQACPGECDPEACGTPPPVEIPIELCEDGTYSGMYCMAQSEDAGECSWEIRRCSYVCTDDAMICPDGSSVGREGPDCEFAPCPAECPEGWVNVSPAGCPSSDVPVLPSAGCYEPCTEVGEACASGDICAEVQTNPCDCGPGTDLCCAACAATTSLCLPDDGDSACSLLVGASFVSVEEHECGLSVDGVAMCQWQISFTADEFTWMHSDVGETGAYVCREGQLRGGRDIEGIFDAASGQLVWDGVDYSLRP